MKKLRAHMHNKRFIIAISMTALLALQGCGPATTAGMLSTSGAATGALIGHKAGKQRPHWIAGGAAAGVAVGSFLNYKFEKQLQAARQQGYEQAMNQSVRQHYWMLQNIQKNVEGSAEHSFSYYPFVRPEYTLDGVTYKESTEYIPLYE